MKNTQTENFLDKLLMLKMSRDGNTNAHKFLQQSALNKPQNIQAALDCASSYFVKTRFFIPPKEQDRVIMFGDKSGVYVHSDGLCTIMGKDISHEVNAWTETKN